MSVLTKNNSCVQLAQTNCSFDLQQSDKQEKVNVKNRGKKRIGRYSFYLKNLIGSGFSSRVYKGIKDNDKSICYAIKVIKMKDMNIGNIHLLNNQIDIIQKLDHPNLVKFIDVLYTNHHCYLIMQYCEGGNLEKYVKNHDSIPWGSIVHQIIEGCQYLSINNIVHRDLKPANIFRKNKIWKIGDFGFSKRIPNPSSLIIQNCKVGSPIFMPLQTLQRNMYSCKSDSFALGKQYPWCGSNLQKLIKNYKQKDIDFSRMQLIPLQIKQLIKGLCCMDMKKRLSIQECDASIFLNQKSIGQIQKGLLSLKIATEQVILCQFINYLLKNSILFLQDNHILYSLMSSNLSHLTNLFKWQQNRSLKLIKNDYILPETNIKINQAIYRKILKALQQTINDLKLRDNPVIFQVGLQKILQYRQIIKCILEANMQKLSILLKKLTLHKSFHDLMPNHSRILQLMSTSIFKQ